MNIRWLVLFSAIAEEGSFTRAATRLNIAQPWLSAQLRKLEDELGVKLFERLNAGIELTQEGRELLPYAHQVAEASKKFRDLARTMGDGQSRVLRIGSYLPMIDIGPLRRLNDNFVHRYSNFSIHGASGPMPELLSELQLGQLDIVAAISPIDDGSNYERISLGVLKPYLLVSRNSLLADMEAVDDRISGQQVAAPPEASHPALYQALFAPLRAAGATIKTVPEVDKRAMEHFARTHGASVLMIEGREGDYAKDPELATVPLQDIIVESLLIRVKGRELSRAAEWYWSMASSAAAATDA